MPERNEDAVKFSDTEIEAYKAFRLGEETEEQEKTLSAMIEWRKKEGIDGLVFLTMVCNAAGLEIPHQPGNEDDAEE